jgi:hypothetical protein
MKQSGSVLHFVWAVSDDFSDERLPTRRQLEADGWRFVATHPLYPSSHLMCREDVTTIAGQEPDGEGSDRRDALRST